jgi:hypothetical protein
VEYLAGQWGVPKDRAPLFALRLCREAHSDGPEGDRAREQIAAGLDAFSASPDLLAGFDRFLLEKDEGIGVDVRPPL